jgi:serine protease inhibitor
MTEQPQKLIAGNTQLAFDLYNRLCNTPGNLCFSPYSLLIALSMTYAGARNETEKQMARVLHFPAAQAELHTNLASLQTLINGLDQQETLQILTANALFPHDTYPFLADFLDALKENYQTSLTPLDFSNSERARQQINSWVAEKTRGRIGGLIPKEGVTPQTRLVLVNAIYFKGLWKNQFDVHATREAPFWISPGQSIQVPMMTQTSTFNFSHAQNSQILEMDYFGGQASMVFILPNEPDDLPALEKNLTASTLINWLSQLTPTEVDLRLPRFSVKDSFALKNTFVTLGMPDAFDPIRADFSGMDGQHFPVGLLIDEIFHQATTEVNEQGATATAATAIVMKTRGFGGGPEFHVDHPFLFLIREKSTGSILFLGRVGDPRGDT